jgi:hypothetical protein
LLNSFTQEEEKVFEPLPNYPLASGDKPALKELVSTLAAAARERGIKLPTDEQAVSIALAQEIMSATNEGEVDANAVIETLKERYGTTAEKKKASKKGAKEVVVPGNAPICDMLKEISGESGSCAISVCVQTRLH